MFVYNCATCGNQFQHSRKNKKYCSMDCYNIERNTNGVDKSFQLKGKCKDCGTAISIRKKSCTNCRDKFLAQPRKRFKMTDRITCDKCGIIKTSENTFSPEPGLWSTKCRKCCRIVGKTSETNIKQKCVDYKGGSCQICGYNRTLSALDFHHIDPTQKDFTIAHKRGNAFDEKMRTELDKCILICSNCHREEHSRLASGEQSLLLGYEQVKNFSVWDFLKV